jgi:methylphosphotriester-DNA--protein-cysteine methyltransferase
VSGRDFDHGMINYMAEHGDVSMVSHRHMAWTSIEFAPELLTTDFKALAGTSGPTLDHGAMFVQAGSVAWDRLRDVCRTTLRLGMTDATAFDADAAGAAAAGALIDAVSNCLTNGTQQPDRAASGRRHIVLRRMIDAIEGDHRSDLTMASLCQAANVSARTLHEVAMEYLGMPPGQYQRNHRLRLVHQALRESDPDSTTVAVAMTRNGLWELERAISAYQGMFGQSPADTLNKAPRSVIVEGRSAGLHRRRA